MSSQNMPSFLQATIDKNPKGFAFLVFDNREFEDLFLPAHVVRNLYKGDRVKVELSPAGEILDLQIINRRIQKTIGRFSKIGHRGLLVIERKQERDEVIVIGDSSKVPENAWVLAKFEYQESGPRRARIEKVFGDTIPASADLEIVSGEFNLQEHHTEAAEREARSFTLDLNSEETKSREDLRSIPFITIDGERARDFDDAVYVERLPNRHYRLWVAIADVSFYVRPGSAIDGEAYARGTSVYFPERAFHMLPSALSEELCSLKPKVPRYSLACSMEFDSHGHIQKQKLHNAIIESRRRATYEEIQQEWLKNKSNPDWEYHPHFELFEILLKERASRGSIDFDLPESEVMVDAEGEPTDIVLRPRFESHRLIEAFMIAANEAVTRIAAEQNNGKGTPFVYRVHESPPPKALQTYSETARQYGLKFKAPAKDLGQYINEFVQSIADHPAKELLNQSLLRAMSQARYSEQNLGHFGLSSKNYTHFTSPIRRYPDLIVHRILKQIINHQLPKGKEIGQTTDKLATDTEHCSQRERLATEAERLSKKIKQIRILQKHIGEVFDAKVQGIHFSGIYLQIQKPYVEGHLPEDILLSRRYEYDESRNYWVSRDRKHQLKVGDPILVKCLKAEVETRTTVFDLEITPGAKK